LHLKITVLNTKVVKSEDFVQINAATNRLFI
jgi:hypothetical protein